MVVMGEENIPLEGPERVLQGDKSRFPVVYNFQVCDDLEEILIPLAIFVLSHERPFSDKDI